MRGVFIYGGAFSWPVDWNLIADTCVEYKVTDVFLQVGGYDSGNGSGGYYGSSHYGDQLANCINAFHPRGIRVHAEMSVVYCASYSDPPVLGYNSALVQIPWNDPTNPIYINMVHNVIGNLSTYDIDGFMFDYIRYDSADMSYSNTSKAQLEAYLGETITNWPGDFAPAGSRYLEFLEWRLRPINDMVTRIRDWFLPIKPNMQFSVAAWSLFQNATNYWRYWLGQDTAYWVSQDYLDFVVPMIYTDDSALLEDALLSDQIIMTGGKEGKVPLVPIYMTELNGVPIEPAKLAAVMQKARDVGADGWIIWYGGPGVTDESYVFQDIRNYLSLIDLPDTFSISNIQTSTTQTTATINWTTNLPATSKVEYSTSPLFNASYLLGANNLHYWKVTHTNKLMKTLQTPRNILYH
jgi:hypothetical protein